MSSPAGPFEAIILAGGSSRRFGGRDKALVTLAGRSFLERALAAVEAARVSVVVGPRRAGFEGVVWVEEATPRGPVSALLDGVRATDEEVVVVLAVDMPLVSAADVRALVTALTKGGSEGAALAHAEGDPQFLAGAYRREPLLARLEKAAVEGARLRDVMTDLRVGEVISKAARDCDSPGELQVLEEELQQRP